jgi:hypothetical protein
VYGVEPICATLTSSGCKVAPRAYRSWKSAQPSLRMLHDAIVVDKLRSTIGTPEGMSWPADDDRLAASEGASGLLLPGRAADEPGGSAGSAPRQQVKTTIPAKDHHRAEDQLNRDFAAVAPNWVWVADFERHEAFANPGGGGRPPRDACRSRHLEAGGRPAASAWGWLVEQSSTTTRRLSTARWGGLG